MVVGYYSKFFIQDYNSREGPEGLTWYKNNKIVGFLMEIEDISLGKNGYLYFSNKDNEAIFTAYSSTVLLFFLALFLYCLRPAGYASGPIIGTII